MRLITLNIVLIIAQDYLSGITFRLRYYHIIVKNDIFPNKKPSMSRFDDYNNEFREKVLIEMLEICKSF